MTDDTFRWVIAAAVAISTLCIFIMAAVALMVYRVVAKVQSRVDDVATRVEPIIATVRRLTDESAPRVSEMTRDAQVIVANAKDVSVVARDQAHRFAEVGRDIADRAKAQVARVDAAVDQTVDQVHYAGDHVKAAMLKPVREASGVLAGVKAAVSSFAQGKRGTTMDHITQDEEMFI